MSEAMGFEAALGAGPRLRTFEVEVPKVGKFRVREFSGDELFQIQAEEEKQADENARNRSLVKWVLQALEGAPKKITNAHIDSFLSCYSLAVASKLFQEMVSANNAGETALEDSQKKS